MSKKKISDDNIQHYWCWLTSRRVCVRHVGRILTHMRVVGHGIRLVLMFRGIESVLILGIVIVVHGMVVHNGQIDARIRSRFSCSWIRRAVVRYRELEEERMRKKEKKWQKQWQKPINGRILSQEPTRYHLYSCATNTYPPVWLPQQCMFIYQRFSWLANIYCIFYLNTGLMVMKIRLQGRDVVQPSLTAYGFTFANSHLRQSKS